MVSVGGYSVLPALYAAAYVRQLAVHANLAVLAHRKQNSTWVDRLKQIEIIRRRHLAAPPGKTGGGGGGGTPRDRERGASGSTGSASGMGVSVVSPDAGFHAASEAAALPSSAFDFTLFMGDE